MFTTDVAIPLGVRLDYVIQGASANDEAVTLNLGQPNFMTKEFPAKRYLRNQGFPGLLRNAS